MMTWMSLFFQSPSTYLMEIVILMHDYVMMFLFSVLITILFGFMSLAKMSKFNMEFFENHQLENMWTILPFIILMFIAIPSLNSLYLLDSCLFCGLTLNIIGHQWYWSYIFKQMGSMSIDSYMSSDSSASLRLIDVDNRIVIPTSMPMRFIVTSADVIHSWTVPSMGFKMDAVPGRLNQFCMATKKSGVYFGQCSEICGANHSFMPIVLESIPVKHFMKLI